MNIQSKLDEIGLTPENSIVIGSGILNALNIRESNDIDLVVDESSYIRLSQDPRFKKTENHGKEILADETFEIGTSWTQLGNVWKFENLLDKSVVLDGVRYHALEFLLEVKQSWLKDADVRQKDVEDVK